MAGTYGRVGGSYRLMLKMPQIIDIYISLTMILAITHTVVMSAMHATCHFETPFSLSFWYWPLCSYLGTELRSLKTTSPYWWIAFLPLTSVTCGCPLPSFTFRVFFFWLLMKYLCSSASKNYLSAPLSLFLTSSFWTVSAISLVSPSLKVWLPAWITLPGYGPVLPVSY